MTPRALEGAYFVCVGGDNFDFEAPSLGEYAIYVTSVSVYCEGLS